MIIPNMDTPPPNVLRRQCANIYYNDGTSWVYYKMISELSEQFIGNLLKETLYNMVDTSDDLIFSLDV